MHILVDIEGVLRGRNSEPIGPGILMVGTLSVHNTLTFMCPEDEVGFQHWLDSNKIVECDRIIDGSVGLVDENLKERQVKLARARGPVDLFVTNDPSLWAFAFDQGIPSVMFGVPSYTRVEFRPDAPREIRAWGDIEESIKKQTALRTNDARITRTEALNFE
jgi:hypothetical protein